MNELWVAINPDGDVLWHSASKHLDSTQSIIAGDPQYWPAYEGRGYSYQQIEWRPKCSDSSLD